MDEREFWSKAASYRRLSGIPLTRNYARRAFAALCNEYPGEISRVDERIADLPIELDFSIPADRTIYLQGACDLRGVRAIERVMTRLNVRTAWDVGANRGNHSAFMRRHCDRLFSFEPNPREFARLKTLFRADRGVIPLNIGLSDQVGELPFLIFDSESGNSTLEVSTGTANCVVSVSTGDRIAADHVLSDVDFIKLDVEGHEKRAITGMRSIFHVQRPVMIFEILEAQSTPDIDFADILPNYRIFGNKTGPVSRVTMSAYDFCPFEYGKTYMCALAAPEERLTDLADLLPSP
jgi:FkbM family methyltransferase